MSIEHLEKEVVLSEERKKILQLEKKEVKPSTKLLSEQWNLLTSPAIKGLECLGETFKVITDLNIIRPGFITIGGEPSSGKSSLVTQLIKDILLKNQDYCALIISIDDSIWTTAKRILSQATFTDWINENHSLLETDKTSLNNLFSRIAISEERTIYDIATQITNLKKITGRQKIIVSIDYLQLVDIESNDIRTGLNDFTRELKEMQKNTPDMIVFCLSQFSRQGKEKLYYKYRETSEIENLSDVCIDIEKQEEENKRLIKIIKNKFGILALTGFSTSIGQSYVFQKCVINTIKSNKISSTEEIQEEKIKDFEGWKQ